MPEGPEIFIVSTILNSKCKGKKILNVVIHPDSRYISDKRFDPCIGKTIRGVQSKGKKIIFALSDDCYLLSSLAMEGNWTLESSLPKDTRHLSVSIQLTDKYLLFRDVRHFGDLSFCKSSADLNILLKAVGPSWIPSEMFPQQVSLKYFTEALQGNTRIRNKPIMIFLMDQKFTSGVGNYIRAEALYIAKISPYKPIGDLTSVEIENLYSAINQVMKKALDSGGHTLKSYSSPLGVKGGYIPLVYGRSNTLDNNEPIIREVDSQGRAIHWVPTLQN